MKTDNLERSIIEHEKLKIDLEEERKKLTQKITKHSNIIKRLIRILIKGSITNK